MERLRTHLQPHSARRSLILIGIILLLFGILTTTYVAQQQQEIRKRAQTVCELSCNTQFDTCANSCVADPLSQAPQCQGNNNPFQCCLNFCNDQWGSCMAGCSGQSPMPSPTPTPNIGASPRVDTLSISPSSTALTGTTDIEVTVSGVADLISVYIHGINPPTASDPESSTYNPDSVAQDTFYFIGTIQGSSGTVTLNPAAPTKPGTYSIVANAQLGGTTCVWNDSSCNTPGVSQGVQLDWPSVTSVSTNPTSLSCAFPPCRSVDLTGQAGQFWVYIHKGVPNVLSPVSTSLYNPNSIDDNTFYTIGPISEGLLVFSEPKIPGTYSIVVNAHSQSQSAGGLPVWSPFERVCAWDDQVYQPPPITPEGSTCTNASPTEPFTISPTLPTPTIPPGVSPTEIPTPTPAPTLFPSVTPTGTPIPTSPPGMTPTRTPTPAPTTRVTSVPTGVPGLGPNATGLFVSLTLEGFPGTYTPLRRIEPIAINLRSQTASISAGASIGYSDFSRRFDGLINLGDNVADGEYSLFVKPISYLRREFGTIRIRSRTVNFVSFSPGPLLSCDLNNDNIVNVLDFGQVYTDIKRNVRESFADIGRDGDVDIFDHNFCVQNFLEEGARL